LEPLQQRYSLIMSDAGYLDEVLAKGAGEFATDSMTMSGPRNAIGRAEHRLKMPFLK
jgi:hypothetical protein